MKIKEIQKARKQALKTNGPNQKKVCALCLFYSRVLRDIVLHGHPMDKNKAKAALGYGDE